MKRTARLATMLLIATMLPACSGVQQTGVRIGDPTLQQFQAGITTEQWLLAILGPPTSQAAVKGVQNTKVLKYHHIQSSGGLTTFFSGGGSRSASTTYFIVTDGVVTRFWADREVRQPLWGTSGQREATHEELEQHETEIEEGVEAEEQH